MARTTTQKAILKTDVEKTAPEKQNKPTISKSRKRTSLEEFAAINQLRPEVKAGFKVWLNGQYFHFDEEWQDLFKQYKNR